MAALEAVLVVDFDARRRQALSARTASRARASVAKGPSVFAALGSGSVPDQASSPQVPWAQAGGRKVRVMANSKSRGKACKLIRARLLLFSRSARPGFKIETAW